MNIINEILADYESYCHEKLSYEFGNYNPQGYNAIHLYQRFKVRIIEVRPRAVFQTSNLVIPTAHANAFQKIVQDIQDGQPLKKYQSRKLKQLSYNDDMLSHWGIQHFHLGDIIESDGFVKRTRELLFVHFSKNEAHILGFYNHKSWTNLNLIEIIHKNWPYCLTTFKLNSDEPLLTEIQIRNLRSRNMNSNITVSDGTEYLCPGMGVMLNGTPLLATLNSQKVISMFENYFEVIKNNINTIIKADKENTYGNIATIGLNDLNTRDNISFVIKETGFSFHIES